jgi:hypothetical protein
MSLSKMAEDEECLVKVEIVKKREKRRKKARNAYTEVGEEGMEVGERAGDMRRCCEMR